MAEFIYHFLKNKKSKYGKTILLFLAGILSVCSAGAVTRTSTAAGGNWASTTTWSGGVVPANTDVVVIATTGTNKVTVAAIATCAGVTINSGATLVSTTLTLTVNGPWVNNGTYTQGTATVTFGSATAAINSGSGTSNFNNISIASGATLMINDAVTVSGTFSYAATAASNNVTISGSNSLTTGAISMPLPSAGATCTMAVNAGVLTAASLSMAATTIATGTRTNILIITTGTCTITGNVTLSGTTGDIFTFSGTGAGTLNMGGTVSTGPPTFTASDGTVNYNGAGSQTIWGVTYFDLNTANGGTKTLGGAATVSDIITVGASTTLALGANTLTLPATGSPFVNNGTFTPGTGTVTYSGGGAQTVADEIYNNLTFSGAGTKTILTGTAVTVNSNWTVGSPVSMTGTASLTVTGSFTGAGAVTMGSGTLNLGGATTNAFANNGTFTPGTGTVNYTRNGAQTVRQTTYNNLTLSGTGTNAKTTTTITVNGILSMEGTATASAAPTYGANATLQYNTNTNRNTGTEWPATFTAGTLQGGVVVENTGDITFVTPAKTLGAGMPLTIATNGSLSVSTFGITLNDDFINNGGTLTGSGAVTITGTANQSIGTISSTGLVTSTKSSGTATFTGNVNAASFTINNTGTGILNLGAGFTHTFTGAFTRTAGTLEGNTSTLNIGGAVTNTGGTFTANTGTVNFTGASGQTIPPLTYYDLGFSGAGTKTIAAGGTVTVGDNWAVNAPVAMSTTANATVTGDISGSGAITMGTGTITLDGDWTNNGTFTSGTGTVIYHGAAQSVAALSYNNLQTSSAGIKTLSGATTVKGILTVNTPSEIDLGSVTLTLSGSGTPLTVTGIFTASASTVTYTSSSSTTITGVNYNNLAAAGGNRTLSTIDTIGIAGVFTPGAGTYTVANSKVNFNGSGTQNIPAFTFNELYISNTNIKKILAAVAVICQTLTINDDATVEIDADGGGLLTVLQ